MTSGLEYRVYNATGTTLTGYVTRGSDKEFVDSLNEPGYGQVVVPLGSPDAALLVRDALVRVFYNSQCVFAWSVESRDDTIVDSSGTRFLRAAGRSPLAWLEDALVWPQAGLQSYNSPDRPFNYASKDGYWKSTVTWSAPLAADWSETTTARSKQPRKWDNVDRQAKWIWSTSPIASVQEGTVNWFRSTFTVSEPTTIRIFCSADNAVDLALDGATVITASDFDASTPTWTQFVRFTARVGAGEHVLGARVRNGKPWRAEDLSVSNDDNKVRASDHGLTAGTRVEVLRRSKPNGLTVGNVYFLRDVTPDDFKLAATSGGSAVNITADSEIDLEVKRDNLAGLLVSVRRMEDGKPTTVLRRTDTANWEVATEEPKHRPALILKTLLQEAQARDVYRLDAVGTDFTNSADSGAGAWTTEVDLSIPVGTTLLAVMDQMVDLGVDFHVDPVSLVLKSWESRGMDRSTSVRLMPGLNLLSYSVASDPRVKTSALVRTKDGWTQKPNVNAETWGRRELYVEVGRTRSESTARIIAERILRRTGKQLLVASKSDATPVPGADPYTDFAVGDVISVPSSSGTSWTRARVLSISMKDEDGTATYTPELEVLDA
jgi:hypothetical protein